MTKSQLGCLPIVTSPEITMWVDGQQSLECGLRQSLGIARGSGVPGSGGSIARGVGIGKGLHYWNWRWVGHQHDIDPKWLKNNMKE